MILTYRISKGFLDTDQSKFIDHNESRTRGYELKLYEKRSILKVQKASFSQRIINDWNKLPSTVVNGTSVKQFEIEYVKHEVNNRFSFT